MQLQATRPSVQWKTLTALTRRIQDQHPEWVGSDLVDAIKTELVRQGFQDPLTERIYQALDAVDRARQASSRSRTPSPASKPPAPRPLTPGEQQTLLRTLRDHFGNHVGPKAMPSEPFNEDARRAELRQQVVAFFGPRRQP